MTKLALESCSDDILFACEKCDFTSKNENELQRHADGNHAEAEVEVHMNEKHKGLHKCAKCPAKFRMKEQFKTHMESHEFHCFYKGCGCQTETEEQMITHIDEYHILKVSETKEQVTETPKQKTKISKECRYFKQGKCTTGDECIFKHVKGKYKCDKCNIKTDTRETVEEHIKNKHTEERQTTSSKACKNGANCEYKAKNKCKFSHKEESNKSEAKKCKRGESCYYKTKGNCCFYHEDVGVQSRRESFEIESQGQSRLSNSEL